MEASVEALPLGRVVGDTGTWSLAGWVFVYVAESRAGSEVLRLFYVYVGRTLNSVASACCIQRRSWSAVDFSFPSSKAQDLFSFT